jgi:hypothetical protein
VHYSSGESVDTGVWGVDGPAEADSLADRVEVAVVTFLQKNPDRIFLEIEDDLYPRFPGLLTPSKMMIYAVLNSYAERIDGVWRLRSEDQAAARRRELETIRATIRTLGKRLGYSTSSQDRNDLWQENGRTLYVFPVLASALIGRVLSDLQLPPGQAIMVLPGGRASLASYKAQRDPALAARLKEVRVVKYRLLRTLLEVPGLTREMFDEQIASDPLEKPRLQMSMF